MKIKAVQTEAGKEDEETMAALKGLPYSIG